MKKSVFIISIILVCLIPIVSILYGILGIYHAEYTVTELETALSQKTEEQLDNIFTDDAYVNIDIPELDIKISGGYSDVKDDLLNFLNRKNTVFSLQLLNSKIDYGFFRNTMKGSSFISWNSGVCEKVYKIEMVNMFYKNKISCISIM